MLCCSTLGPQPGLHVALQCIGLPLAAVPMSGRSFCSTDQARTELVEGVFLRSASQASGNTPQGTVQAQPMMAQTCLPPTFHAAAWLRARSIYCHLLCTSV